MFTQFDLIEMCLLRVLKFHELQHDGFSKFWNGTSTCSLAKSRYSPEIAAEKENSLFDFTTDTYSLCCEHIAKSSHPNKKKRTKSMSSCINSQSYSSSHIFVYIITFRLETYKSYLLQKPCGTFLPIYNGLVWCGR